MKRPFKLGAAAAVIVTLLSAAPSAARQEQTTNEVAQLKATVSAVFSELQRERERAEALASELAKARREAETAAAASGQKGDEAVQQKQAAEEAIADLQRLLQLEKEKTAALTQAAKAAREAMTANVEPQRRVLDEAPARGAALAGELAGTRLAPESQTVQLQKAVGEALQQKQTAERASTELQQLLRQEQKKTAALTQQVGVARQAMTANAEQQRRALDDAQTRAMALASELAGTRLALESQAGQSQTAIDEAVQQKQTAAGAIVELQQLLRLEQKKTAALTQQVGAARQAMTANAEQQRRAIDEAQARAAALASELAETRRAIGTQAAQSRKAIDEAVQQQQRTAEGVIADLQQLLHHDDDRIGAMARGFASDPRTKGGRVIAEVSADSVVHMTQVVKMAVTGPLTTAEAQGSAASIKLIARASVLLGQGNIGAARIVLEPAADSGNAQASFMLAETYDPVILSAWGTYGTRGEAAKARELYAKAQAGGMREAKDRLDALRQ
jgi:hypothetical protein